MLGCAGVEMETKHPDYYSCSTEGYRQVPIVWDNLTKEFGIKAMNDLGYMVSFYCKQQGKNIEGEITWR